MHYIGKINLDIYRCITEDIVTDEVIITDNRIDHIISRRGQEFYDKYHGRFAEILNDPDYIFKDDLPNTAIVCKGFVEDGKYINIVLRVVVEGDNPSYKNSIVTAIGTSEKRFAQMLRNNQPIYSKNIDKA